MSLIAAAAAAKRKAQAKRRRSPETHPSIDKASSAAGSKGEASPAPGSDTEEVVQSGDEIDAHMVVVMRKLDEIIESGWETLLAGNITSQTCTHTCIDNHNLITCGRHGYTAKNHTI